MSLFSAIVARAQQGDYGDRLRWRLERIETRPCRFGSEGNGECAMELLWQFVNVIFAVVAIVEWVGTQRFRPWAYRTGIRVIHETRALAQPPRSARSEFETKSGRFKIVGPQLCLFHYPAFMPIQQAGLPQRSGPLLYPPFIKGTLEWNDSQITMQGRVSLLVTVVLIHAAAALTFLIVMPPSDPAPVVFFLVMWTLIIGAFLLLLWYRIRSATRILNEFEAEMSSRAQRAPS
jgi:hypothetical protein